MDTTSILIPVVILLLVILLLWRLRNAGQEKDYSNTLLKVRKKRQGSIYSTPKSPKIAIESSKNDVVEESSEATSLSPPPELAEIQLIDYEAFVKEHKASNEFKRLRKPHPLLMSLSRSITDAQELINIVKSDPELVAMVLNMANSPFFGLRKAITDINHAVVYLGIAQVKNLATQFAISQSFEFESEKQKAAYEKIWKTSFLASAMALLIAREANLETPSELSTRCLLSYLGDITLLSMDAKAANFYIDRMPMYMRVRGMQSLFKSNAAVMGGLFAQHLKLPKELHTGIGMSYQPLTNDWDRTYLTDEEIQDTLFCYSICRAAEYYILEQDDVYSKDPNFSYKKSAKPEFYHLEQQLEQHGLSHLNKVISAAGTKMKLSHMFASLKEKMK
uniref:HDOD domain-containing protein n=1 Tax=Ningiella ruwaisensis TaxID=2364274 RepID=UPI0010A02EC9|nr:HDOD domain-containing protein [Ningiella ruwaisensis]